MCSKVWILKHNSSLKSRRSDYQWQRDFNVDLAAVTFTTVLVTKLPLWQKLSAIRHSMLYKVWKYGRLVFVHRYCIIYT